MSSRTRSRSPAAPHSVLASPNRAICSAVPYTHTTPHKEPLSIWLVYRTDAPISVFGSPVGRFLFWVAGSFAVAGPEIAGPHRTPPCPVPARPHISLWIFRRMPCSAIPELCPYLPCPDKPQRKSGPPHIASWIFSRNNEAKSLPVFSQDPLSL